MALKVSKAAKKNKNKPLATVLESAGEGVNLHPPVDPQYAKDGRYMDPIVDAGNLGTGDWSPKESKKSKKVK